MGEQAEDGRTSENPAKAANEWRAEIALRVRELRARLCHATAVHEHCRDQGDPDWLCEDAVFKSYACAVEVALEDASSVVRESSDPWDWWTGRTITVAWEAIHRAEAGLICISPNADALAALPQLIWWMEQVAADRHAVSAYKRQLQQLVDERKPDRMLLRQAYQYTIARNVEWHSSLRAFRNVLFAVAASLALALAVVSIWHAWQPDFVGLCSSSYCFDGDGTSARTGVIEIVLLGALGGLLSSAFLLSKVESAPSRYNLLAPQIVLKALAGAATALVGVLLVQSHFVNHVGGNTDAELVAYAAVFGFSQELLTRFVDKQANTLLGTKSG